VRPAGDYTRNGRTCAVCGLWSYPKWRLYTLCGTQVRWALGCPRSWDAERHGVYAADGTGAAVDCPACLGSRAWRERDADAPGRQTVPREG
jgi:hypothetical protein